MGYAHLPIIKMLNEKGIKPAETIGTSMGAIFSAFMAIGLNPDEIEKIFLKNHSYFKWLRLSLKESLISLQKIKILLEQIFGNQKIKQTKIPLKIVSYNLNKHKCHIFDKETYIKDAILASIAIPGIFEDVIIGDTWFADGCLCENLPVSFADEKLIMAVNVLEGMELESLKNINIFKKLEIFARILINNNSICDLKLQQNKDVFLITPEKNNFNIYDFDKFDQIKRINLSGNWLDRKK
ncbi:patatin-like phospholipase family protein [Nautilia lithotrophica]